MKKPNGNNNPTTINRPHVTFSVSRVKLWENERVTFTLTINDVTIYNCRVVESDSGDFIAFPSRKGSDGKYYSHVYIQLMESEIEAIIGEVERQLNGN